MVKVDNVFGDITTGRQGEAVYQRKYGRGMRRLFNDLNKNPSQSQLDQRANFKRSIAWVKGLSYAEKQAIKEYCRINRVGYKDGEPIHWYNWAKRLGIARPKFKVVDSVTGKYRVSHPALYRIEEIDKTGAISFSIDELSDVLDSRYLGVYEQTPGTPISMVRITTLPGIVFDYPVSLVTPVTRCIPCFREICLEYRAVEVEGIMDDCWQIEAESMTDGTPSDCEYNHFV